ncbi:unnamed protein product, partial [Arabidopsis halleri]
KNPQVFFFLNLSTTFQTFFTVSLNQSSLFSNLSSSISKFPENKQR